MATAPNPSKQNIPHELWRIATTLTQEAQDAALRKARELALDVDRGHIPFEESLINLSSARDILLDAVNKNKVTQLPLKLQYSLLDQIRNASEELTSLANGKDTALALEAVVEDLTASIWTYRLHNLSGEVLGYETKMNQLKAQETAIRRASQEAATFAAAREQAAKLAKDIQDLTEAARSNELSIEGSLGKISEAVQQSTETQQKTAALAVQVQQNEITIAQQLANATQAAATVQALEKVAKEASGEISETKAKWSELLAQAQDQLRSTQVTTGELLEAVKTEFHKQSEAATTTLSQLSTSTDSRITGLETSAKEQLEALTGSVRGAQTAAEDTIKDLVTSTKERMAQAESTQELKLQEQLNASGTKHNALLTENSSSTETALKDFALKSQEALDSNQAKFTDLVKNLDELEGRIRESIERATGHSLFHSFQKRQLDVAKSRKMWAYALGAMVVLSLTASALFLYYLSRFQGPYNAAFYLKLSISIPLIYAIAFCNLQYSRERRLEEEYAFKSNISISLDPYQRLVGELVDKNKPEELAKYTAFIIESVSKVFTSPTEPIFDDRRKDVTAVQKLLKSLGDLAEPLIKALKK